MVEESKKGEIKCYMMKPILNIVQSITTTNIQLV